MTVFGAGASMARPSTAPGVRDDQPRCVGQYRGKDGALRPCRALLGVYNTRPWRIDCARCGTVNERL